MAYRLSTAAMPTPPAAPSTSSVSPAGSAPRSPERMLARAVSQEKCRRFLVRHAVGDPMQLTRVYRHFFREGTHADDGHHPIAACHGRHAGTDLFHDTGQLASGCERQRRLTIGNISGVSAINGRGILGLSWFAEPLPRRSSLTPSPIAHLVPTYDEFLIAYQDRQFITRESAATAIYTGRDGYIHHLMIDGRLAGCWKRTERAGAHTLSIAPYGRITREEKQAIRSAADRYQGFLGRPLTLIGV